VTGDRGLRRSVPGRDPLAAGVLALFVLLSSAARADGGLIVTPVVAATDADSPINIDVLSSIYEDTAGVKPRVSSIDDAGTRGLVRILSDGRIGYSPSEAFKALAVGQSGTDRFRYVVTDANGRTGAADVTVTVTGNAKLAGAAEGGSLAGVPIAATASVDFAKPLRVRSMAGVLLSASPDTPPTGMIDQIQVKYWRQGSTRLYDRAMSLNGTYEFVLSEGWGYPANGWGGKGPPYRDWTKWEDYVRSVARQNVGRRMNWAVWNEPEWHLFWDGTPQQLYETYLHAYRVLRQELGPQAIIGGPSVGLFDWSYIKGFADFCLASGCEINFLSWHELTPGPRDRTDIRRHLDLADAQILRNPAYAPLRLRWRIVNEVTGLPDQYFPAEILSDLTALEDGGADFAARACWANSRKVSNCSNNSLDGLLAEDGSPRAGWWTYKVYADGVAGRVQASGDDPRLVVRASRVAHGAQILVGAYALDKRPAPRIAVTIALANLSAAGFEVGQKAHVEIFKIPDSGEAPLAQPISLETATYAVEPSARLKLPAIAAHEVLLVVLSR